MRTRSLLALLAAGTIALAACGSDNSSSSSNAPAAAPTTTAATSATTAAASSGTPTTAASSATTDSDDSGYGPAPTTAAPAAAASGSATITLADSKLGKIVVDSSGMTLYAFLKDTGGTSSCSGACANAWPPAMATGTPTAGAGISEMLSTVARPDGTMQLKLGDWPLYHFAGDAAKGDVNGQGTGNVWYVVGADGQPIK